MQALYYHVFLTAKTLPFLHLHTFLHKNHHIVLVIQNDNNGDILRLLFLEKMDIFLCHVFDNTQEEIHPKTRFVERANHSRIMLRQ